MPAKSTVDETISIYQAQIAAVQPWPSPAEILEAVGQGWVEVCSSRNLRVELDDEIFKVVSLVYIFFLYHLLVYILYAI